MATYVLVHGGAHGGWCYQRVARILRAAGHDVYTPTMTGVGERSHLVSADVDLDLHIRDITAVLHYEDLRDVILVGHSYGGMVITGVSDRAVDRVGRVRSMTDDVQAIENLIYAYAELLDIGDLEGLGRLFTGATLRTSGASEELQGAAAVQRLIERSVHLYEGVPGTKHLVTNVIVEVADDRRSATARSYYTALQARPELPLQAILAGRWHDRFRREDDRWRFVDRLIYTDLVGDLRSHIKGFPT